MALLFLSGCQQPAPTAAIPQQPSYRQPAPPKAALKPSRIDPQRERIQRQLEEMSGQVRALQEKLLRHEGDKPQ